MSDVGTEKGEAQSKTGTSENKKRPAYQTDCYQVLRLKNGRKLVLSSLDAYYLGMWACPKRKHRFCDCSKLKAYGKVSLASEYYMKPKTHSSQF